jgi:hypothetical protein
MEHFKDLVGVGHLFSAICFEVETALEYQVRGQLCRHAPQPDGNGKRGGGESGKSRRRAA